MRRTTLVSLLFTLAMGLRVLAQPSSADSSSKAVQATPAVVQNGVVEKEFEDGESPEDRMKFELLLLQDEKHHYDPQQKVRAHERRKEILRAGGKPGAWPHLAAQQQISATTQNGSVSGLAAATSSIQSSGWKALGPGNIGGRTRSILIHPTLPGTMWLGSVGGGVWKTTNGGQTWAPLNDFMGNIAIGCMALDPANPNVLYAGTGEGFYNNDGQQGAGIFKSTDGGTTWAQLAATATTDWYYVNRISINPTDSKKLIAATNSGLWYSTDAGVTWSQRSTTRTTFVQNDPVDGTKAVASGGSASVWYSTDGGFSWSAASGLAAANGSWLDGRTELAYAPSNPNIVYAVEDNLKGQVYKSNDGGRTYALQNPSGGAGLGDIGWYAECLWVDPTNVNHIIVGGQSNASSTDGGVTHFYQDISGHSDLHAIVSAPGFNGTTNQTIFVGGDGGIYRADNVGSIASTATSLNNSLAITQGDGLAGSRQSNFVTMGTQDNGTLLYSGSTTWSHPGGGDGGDCAADPTQDPISRYTSFYGESQAGDGLFRINVDSTGNVVSKTYFGAKPSGANFEWVAPLALDTNATQHFYEGGSFLLRIDNPRTAGYNTTWIVAATPANLNDLISTIAIANGNSDVVWLGLDGGGILKSTNATAGSPVWTRVGQGVLPGRFCTKVTISPTNPDVVYATFGGFSTDNVWVTADGGGTWTSIHHGLPAAPIHGVAIDPNNTSHIYVGTETGVFGSDDNGTTWSATNDGPANVAVYDIKMMGSKLLISTHGRGAFWYDLASVPVVPAAPTGLVDTAGDAQVKLAWTATPGATSYSVKRSTISGGPYATVANGITATSYANTGLTNGTVYFYAVSAVNAAGESPNSSEVTATPVATVPPAPTGLVAAAGNASVSLTWTATPTASAYNVKRATVVGGPLAIVASALTTTSYVNTGLTNGTSYFYVVSATNATGESPNSVEVSATPALLTTVKVLYKAGNTAASSNQIAPHFELVNTGATVVPLSELKVRYWYTVDGDKTQQFACDYVALGCANLTGQFVKMASSAPGADYYYEVGFVTTAGSLAAGANSGDIQTRFNKTDWTNYTQTGDYSFDATKTAYAEWAKMTVYRNGTLIWGTEPGISSLPAVPTGLAATAGNTRATLSWTASSGATGYNVKRATVAGGPYTVVGSTTNTTLADSGLTNGTKYFYVVSATNASGESQNSSEASVTPQPSLPSVPTGLTGTAGNTRATLSWTASSGATGYNVKRATVAGGPYTAVGATANTTLADSGLTNGTKYFYVVSATNASGESQNSSEASVTPVGASALKAQYQVGQTGGSSGQISAQLNIVNSGATSVPLSDLKVRYWYTIDGDVPQTFWCDYAVVGSTNVTGTFTKLATARPGADYYLEFGFSAAAGSIAAGASSGQIQFRTAKSDWSNYTQTGDYSFDPTKTGYADWSKITVYRNGTLVWGSEP